MIYLFFPYSKILYSRFIDISFREKFHTEGKKFPTNYYKLLDNKESNTPKISKSLTLPQKTYKACFHGGADNP